MLEAASQGQPLCRLYSWDGAWVSLGRFQNPAIAVTPGFTNYVTRPTGGKAVLHGHDLTVALALPFKGRAVKEAYKLAVSPILEALNMRGANALMAATPRASGIAPEDCFASRSPYDLVGGSDESKIAGAAMRLAEEALLLQMSIPFQEPLICPGNAITHAIPVTVHKWNWQGFEASLRHVFASSDFALLPRTR